MSAARLVRKPGGRVPSSDSDAMRAHASRVERRGERSAEALGSTGQSRLWSGLRGASFALWLALLTLAGCDCRTDVVGGSCKRGFTPCGGLCVNLRSDSAHCGACFNACEAEETCHRAQCVAPGTEPEPGPCGSNQRLCEEVCRTVTSDVEHCGDCGLRCPEGAYCAEGFCVGDGLEPFCGFPGLLCDGVCINPNIDPAHCGGCGLRCPAESMCNGGVCTSDPGGDICSPRETLCEAICVDTSADPNNCGVCGNACPSGQPCIEGACSETGQPCLPPRLTCAGLCVDPSGDNRHCGRCFNVCEAGSVCSGGSCSVTCPDTQFLCADACVNLASDRNNCGACGVICAPAETCVEGACLPPCALGTLRCGSSCVDAQSDPDNCGVCGRACDTGICVDGLCTGERTGQLVLIGHDYQVTRVNMNRIVGNSVFLAPGNPVRVVSYIGAAPTSVVNGTRRALNQVAAERGRSFSETVSNADVLEGRLEDADVLLIYAQRGASDTALANLGLNLGAAMETFLRNGGVIVVLDGQSTSNAGTWQVLASGNLLAVTDAGEVTGTVLDVVNPGSSIALGSALNYRAEPTSVSFSASDGQAVVQAGDDPVVLHKLFF